MRPFGHILLRTLFAVALSGSTALHLRRPGFLSYSLLASLFSTMIAYVYRSPLLGVADVLVAAVRNQVDGFRLGFGDVAQAEHISSVFARFEENFIPISELDIAYDNNSSLSYTFATASFESPVSRFLPKLGEVSKVNVLMTLPKGLTLEILPPSTPICLIFAAAGDEGFSFRKSAYAEPLLKTHGIASIILQIPFYGKRRLPEQTSASLLYASQNAELAMGATYEGIGIISYLKTKFGHKGPICFAGLSFGGTCTSIAALLAPFDLAAVTLVPSHSPASAYVEGVLSNNIDWKALNNDRQRLHDLLSLLDIPKLASRLTPISLKKRLYYHQISCPHDHYVFYESQLKVFEAVKAMPGTVSAELKLVSGGHVGAFVLHSWTLVDGIVATIEKLKADSED